MFETIMTENLHKINVKPQTTDARISENTTQDKYQRPEEKN